MFQFTKECLIGVEHIDAEHRALFAMINEAMELLKEDNGTTLFVEKNLIGALKRYAEEHFAHEEAYMEQIGDLELPRQRKEHQAFTEYVNNYDMGELSEEGAAQRLNDLLLYLAKWLYRHILCSDMMIGHNRKEKGGELVFTKEYYTGIELVDAQHARLFEIINEADKLIKAELLHDKYDEIVHILNVLKDYTVTHFTDEEAYMERIGYEGLSAQKVAHMSFVDMLNQVNLDNVDDNQQEYLEELVVYLKNWLIVHILKVDKRIPVK
ncbi:MAG: bacteriohemerythrin [Lachnospiraceae bacterium]|nr:bacteriohemerythrin [Lachnospiraceae bacterium]